MRRLTFSLLMTCTGSVILCSCGLVKLPFRVVGAVAEGTAKTGKKAYDASARALTKSDEEKAAEAKKKAKKDAEEKKQENKDKAADPAKPGDPEAPAEIPSSDAEYLPLPGTDQPLPDDAPLPYQGQ